MAVIKVHIAVASNQKSTRGFSLLYSFWKGQTRSKLKNELDVKFVHLRMIMNVKFVIVLVSNFVLINIILILLVLNYSSKLYRIILTRT